MAAPTWPPGPEDAARLTMEEYGLSEADLGIEDPEALEAELLARHLLSPPKRFDSHGSLHVGTPLALVRRRVEAWLRMVTGRAVRLGVSDPPCTDGEGLYLPMAAPAPAEPEADERLFRLMGLVQLGLLDLGLLERHATLVRIYQDFVLRSCYHLLCARVVLDAFTRRLPGVALDRERLLASGKGATLRVGVSPWGGAAPPAPLAPLYEGLLLGVDAGRASGARARAAVDAVTGARGPALHLALLGQAQALRELCRAQGLGAPPVPSWLGVLRPEWILAERVDDAAEREAWRQGLNRPLAMLQEARGPGLPEAPRREAARPGLRERLKRRVLGAPPAAAAPPPAPRPEAPPALPPPPAEEQGVDLLDEWDMERGGHLLAHVRLAWEDAPEGPLSSYTRLIEANARELRAVRRRFAALRQEERWVTGLPEGPEVDLDRALTALTDLAAGCTPKDDLYRRFVRHPQDLCALVLVDLSGSTAGHVLHLEQEALVLLAEGMRALGLPHAIYGFSGEAARRCRMMRIRGFDEPYRDPVLRRMGNLRAGGGTRLGAYVRAATRLLAHRPQPRRLLLVLSDGRPEDQDAYRGLYGVADAAMATREAARAGVRTFCVSLDDDDEAELYLKPIFGPGRYLRMARAEQLPQRLPEIFRDLL